MRTIFLGATKFSEGMLINLLHNGIDVSAIFSIPQEFHISYSKKKVRNYNYADLSNIAVKNGIEYYEVDSIEGKRIIDYEYIIRRINPDVILVLGWFFMIPRRIRSIARYGAWGIHASLLPRYAGNAPLVWAIINGEKETGVTLFKLDDGVDDGDIIAQAAFPIDNEDTIYDVYEKALQCSKKILINALSNINKISFIPQDKTKLEIYPPRSPEDGTIDLEKTAIEIYNFIRAQSKPYPGAFSFIKGKKIIFWKVRYISEFNDVIDISLFEIFSKSEHVYVKLKQGVLELLEINYDGIDGSAYELVHMKRLLGNKLESQQKKR